jgi:probable phosphomutase (TIGR03848 family)
VASIKRILVTGGAGVLGSHLCERLVDAGHDVICLDNFFTSQKTNVAQLLGRPVVTSPLIRCRQTVAAALPAVNPAVDERFTECGYGDWTGKELARLAKDPLWKVVQAHPPAVTFPGGEAMAAMAARAVAAVREWDATVTAERGPDALWLACSHGDVIKAIVADALGLHLDQFQRIVADPASVTAIRYTATRPFVVRLNDSGTDLASLVPPKKTRRRRATAASESDAAVGGGAVGGSV